MGLGDFWLQSNNGKKYSLKDMKDIKPEDVAKNPKLQKFIKLFDSDGSGTIEVTNKNGKNEWESIFSELKEAAADNDLSNEEFGLYISKKLPDEDMGIEDLNELLDIADKSEEKTGQQNGNITIERRDGIVIIKIEPNTTFHVKNLNNDGQFSDEDFIEMKTIDSDGKEITVKKEKVGKDKTPCIVETRKESKNESITTVFYTDSYYIYETLKNDESIKAMEIYLKGNDEYSVRYTENGTVTHAKNGETVRSLITKFGFKNEQEFYQLNPEYKGKMLKVGAPVVVPGHYHANSKQILEQGTLYGEQVNYIKTVSEAERKEYKEKNLPKLDENIFNKLNNIEGLELSNENIGLYFSLNSYPQKTQEFIFNIIERLAKEGKTADEIKTYFLSDPKAPKFTRKDGSKVNLNLFNTFTIQTHKFVGAQKDDTPKSVKGFIESVMGLDVTKGEGKELYNKLSNVSDPYVIMDINEMFSNIYHRTTKEYRDWYNSQVTKLNSEGWKSDKSIKTTGERVYLKEYPPISKETALDMYRAVINKMTAKKGEAVTTKYDKFIEDNRDTYLREFAALTLFSLHQSGAGSLQGAAAQKDILNPSKYLLNPVGKVYDKKGKEIYQTMMADCYKGNKKFESVLKCYTTGYKQEGVSFDKNKMKHCMAVLQNPKSTEAQKKKAMEDAFGCQVVNNAHNLIDVANFVDNVTDMALMIYGTGLIGKGLEKAVGFASKASTAAKATTAITNTAKGLSWGERLTQLGLSAANFAIWEGGRYTVNYYTNDIEEDYTYTEGLVPRVAGGAAFGTFSAAWGQFVTQPMLKWIFKTPQAEAVSKEATAFVSNQLKGSSKFTSKQVLNLFNAGQAKAANSAGKEVAGFVSELTGFSVYEIGQKLLIGNDEQIRQVLETKYKPEEIDNLLKNPDELKSALKEAGCSDEVISELTEINVGNVIQGQLKTLLSFKAVGQLVYMHRAGKLPPSALDFGKEKPLEFETVKQNGKTVYKVTYPDGTTRTAPDMRGVVALSNLHYQEVTLYKPIEKVLEKDGRMVLDEGITLYKDSKGYSVVFKDGRAVESTNLRDVMGRAQAEYTIMGYENELAQNGQVKLPDEQIVTYDKKNGIYKTTIEDNLEIEASSFKELMQTVQKKKLCQSIEKTFTDEKKALFLDEHTIIEKQDDGKYHILVLEDGYPKDFYGDSVEDVLNKSASITAESQEKVVSQGADVAANETEQKTIPPKTVSFEEAVSNLKEKLSSPSNISEIMPFLNVLKEEGSDYKFDERGFVSFYDNKNKTRCSIEFDGQGNIIKYSERINTPDNGQEEVFYTYNKSGKPHKVSQDEYFKVQPKIVPDELRSFVITNPELLPEETRKLLLQDENHFYTIEDVNELASLLTTPENIAIANKLLDTRGNEKKYIRIIGDALKLSQQKFGIRDIIKVLKSEKAREMVLDKIAEDSYVKKTELEPLLDGETFASFKECKIADEKDISYRTKDINLGNVVNIVRDYQINPEVRERINKEVPDGEAACINGKMYCRAGSVLVPINLDKATFDRLFPVEERYNISQGKIGDCYFIAELGGYAATPNGRAVLYSSFRQEGNDIIVTFPRFNNIEVKFKNGDLNKLSPVSIYKHKGEWKIGNSNAQVNACDGIKMIEQAYSFVRNNYEEENIQIVANDKFLMNKQMQELEASRVGAASGEVTSLFKNGECITYYSNFGFTLNSANTPEEALDIMARKLETNPNVFGSLYFSKEVSVDNGKSLIDGHQYRIIGYDKKAQIVKIVNPHDSGVYMEVPLEIFKAAEPSFSVFKIEAPGERQRYEKRIEAGNKLHTVLTAKNGVTPEVINEVRAEINALKENDPAKAEELGIVLDMITNPTPVAEVTERQIDALVDYFMEHYEAKEEYLNSQVKTIGLDKLGTLRSRLKGEWSTRDKITNYIKDAIIKENRLKKEGKDFTPKTLLDAFKDVRDKYACRTVFEKGDYTKHPEVAKLILEANKYTGEKYDEKIREAMLLAASIQSEKAVETIIEAMKKAKKEHADLNVMKISNYTSEGGIPILSEEQLEIIRYAGIDLGIEVSFITLAREADPNSSKMIVDGATTKSQPSGYTALQINFVTKTGEVIEWQFRGELVDQFAEAEHLPYDLRTGKQPWAQYPELEPLFSPIAEMLNEKNMPKEAYKRLNNYFTDYYTHLRKLELGFESKEPKLEDYEIYVDENGSRQRFVFDKRLSAENLIKLHEIAEKVKSKEITKEKSVDAYHEAIGFKPENNNVKTTDELFKLSNEKFKQDTTIRGLDYEIYTPEEKSRIEELYSKNPKVVSEILELQINYKYNSEVKNKFTPEFLSKMTEIHDKQPELYQILLNIDGNLQWMFDNNCISDLERAFDINPDLTKELNDMKGNDGGRFSTGTILKIVESNNANPELTELVNAKTITNGKAEYSYDEGVIREYNNGTLDERTKLLTSLKTDDGKYNIVTSNNMYEIEHFLDSNPDVLEDLKNPQKCKRAKKLIILAANENVNNMLYSNPDLTNYLLDFVPDNTYSTNLDIKSSDGVLSLTCNSDKTANILRFSLEENGNINTISTESVERNGNKEIIQTKFSDGKSQTEEIEYTEITRRGITARVAIGKNKTMYDKDGKPVYTEIHSQSSDVGGAFDIKNSKGTNNGKAKTYGTKTPAIRVDKTFKSQKGDTTESTVIQGPMGGKSTYAITDINGIILTDIVRTNRKVSENITETSVNGQKFKTIFEGNRIIVQRLSESGTVLETAEFNEDFFAPELKDLCKTLPGDFFFLLQKSGIKSVIISSAGQSSEASSYHKTISIDKEHLKNPFVFAHELGHIVEKLICNDLHNDKTLNSIYLQELNAFRNNSSYTEGKIIDYFTDGDIWEDNNNLQETIAETFALSTGLQNNDDIVAMRGIILQEHFPKTMAYIMNKIYSHI